MTKAAKNASVNDLTDDLMSRADVARLLGVSIRTVAGWAQRGTGPAFRRIGRRAIYRRSDVNAWFLEQPTLGGMRGRD